jgi:hypothetical protein
MKIDGVPFQMVDWSSIPVTEHPGASGLARWRAVELGNLRVRRVEYSAGYAADHWCERGHVLFVLEGQLVTELADGQRVILGAGTSYLVADGAMAHRSSSPCGAQLFIVD